MNTEISITVSKKVKNLHPVVEVIIANLGNLDFINFIKVEPDFLRASSEITQGRIRTPITKPNHPTAVGVALILDIGSYEIQFYEITSAAKGYGGRMVGAVMKSLPEDWNGIVVMDYSEGFWIKMIERYDNLHQI